MKEIEPTVSVFELIARATDRLLDDVRSLNDADVAAGSALAGWTRGHVLSHLARQVDALGRLFSWAATGIETQQYANRQARDAEIDASARRPAAAHLADVTRTALQFQAVISGLPAAAWDAPIKPFTGEQCTPKRLLVIRLREVEVHHADLALGYTLSDTPDDAAAILFADLTSYFDEQPTTPPVVICDDQALFRHEFGRGGPTVRGNRGALLSWMTGRSTGEGLTSSSPIPALPPWI